MEKKLIVILGPTGVGKTNISIDIASHINSPIISADSRQIYKGMTIGTDAPSLEQMQVVDHYFVGTLMPEEYYSASEFETDVIELLSKLFKSNDHVVMAGGSMMYIDAVCKGIDEVPSIDANLRKELMDLYLKEGIDPIRLKLKMLDPVFYNQVDLKNSKRIIHAVEVCLMSGRPYSSFRTGAIKKRPFQIIRIGLTRSREELYDNINTRVDQMIEKGLIEEARTFYPQKELNSLNTVGYKELFKYFDGEWTLDFTIDKIKQHSRNYARKQLSWFNRSDDITWINLSNTHNPLSQIKEIIEKS